MSGATVGQPGTWEGGTSSFKIGSLKRRLPAVVLAHLDSNSSTLDNAVVTQQLVLKNLAGVLNIEIAIGFSTPDGEGLSLITPAQIPAGAVQYQLTPCVLTPNAGKILLRPVFQDPTIASNANNPLPQDAPHGWEFSTEADEVYIDTTIDHGLFGGTELEGQIVVAVTVEYNGEWWNTNALQASLSQVQLTGCQVQEIPTEPT